MSDPTRSRLTAGQVPAEDERNPHTSRRPPMPSPDPQHRPRLVAARAYALDAHGDQRYGVQPYSVHLDAVVAQILRFHGDDVEEELLVAGYLHDVLEDTPVTADQLRDRFGSRVTELVHAVTKEPGVTLRERDQITWQKIVETEAAVRLKLADRIANVEACWTTRSKKLFKYKAEYPRFRGALYTDARGTEAEMWVALDELLGW